MNTDQLRQEVFAPIYDRAGFSDYTLSYTPRIIEFLHQHDWIGRNILDLGCGTGVSTEIFAQRNMSVTAVDHSPAMLEMASRRLQTAAYDVDFVNSTLQNYLGIEKTYDLVFCLDVMNHIANVRDLEAIFQRANHALKMEKLLVFDLQTIRGLAVSIGQQAMQILCDADDLFIIARNSFDYDSSSLRRFYTIFQREIDRKFKRMDMAETLRGYPHKGIMGILGRAGFDVKYSLDLDFKPFDNTLDPYGRVILVAQKVQDIRLNN